MALDTADVRRGIVAGRWRKAGAAERIGLSTVLVGSTWPLEAWSEVIWLDW
jgi:hypothetical protein